MFQINRLLLLVLVLLGVLLVSGCDPLEGADEKEADQIEDQQDIYFKTQPIPKFDYSLTRAIMIDWYELQNEKVATYSVVTSDYGQVIFRCPSEGYPIAADTQLTNPLQRAEWGDVAIEQAEPNGTFSSKTTQATIVRCIMSNGDVAPVRAEQNVITFPFPVEVNESGEIVPVEGAEASATIGD